MSKKNVTYRVTTQDADGNITVEEGLEDAPLKGDTFEYEHREVRTGHVLKVERVTEDKDGEVTVETVTELGDTHHALEEPEAGDDLPSAEELANDPGENQTAGELD